MYPKHQEIERKFLVSKKFSSRLWKKADRIVSYIQGYLTHTKSLDGISIFLKENSIHISFCDYEGNYQSFSYELDDEAAQVVREKLVNQNGFISKIRIRTSSDIKPRENTHHRIKSYITIKGSKKIFGMVRPEVEFLIPVSEAEKLLEMCYRPLIAKIRLEISYEGKKWDVDVFQAENDGLIIAEIELDHVNEIFSKPDWCGREVTHDDKYYNGFLIKKPFSSWKKPTTKKGKQKKGLPVAIMPN